MAVNGNGTDAGGQQPSKQSQSQQQQQQSLNLTGYVASLPPSTRAALYRSPWTCCAVLRALPPLARQYVLRMLYTPGAVPGSIVDSWARPDAASRRLHEAAISQLRALSLLAGEGRGAAAAWSLHPSFKEQLRAALSGAAHSGHEADAAVARQVPGPDGLATYAAGRWEALLGFLLDPSGRQRPPDLPVGLRHEPLDIERLAVAAGLLGEDDGALTGRGFRFLLAGTDAQLWALLREYVRSAERGEGAAAEAEGREDGAADGGSGGGGGEREAADGGGAGGGASLAPALSFLMQLGFRRVGQPYPLSALGGREQRIAAHMAQLGLLFTLKTDEGTFYCPTPLASTLCGGGAAAAAALGAGGAAMRAAGGGLVGGAGGSGGGGGYVIVETNFRVYAYTGSRIQVRVLQEFCRLDCALPNLFVGTLTRDSVQAALSKGVTSEDIVGFLTGHAHPQVAARVPSVPETVQDQLRLWERETQRVRLRPAYCYSNFEDEALFERSRAFAQQRGLLLWDSAERRVLVVAAEGHAAVREYIKHLKQQQQQQQALLGGGGGGGGGGGPGGGGGGGGVG